MFEKYQTTITSILKEEKIPLDIKFVHTYDNMYRFYFSEKIVAFDLLLCRDTFYLEDLFMETFKNLETYFTVLAYDTVIRYRVYEEHKQLVNKAEFHRTAFERSKKDFNYEKLIFSFNERERYLKLYSEFLSLKKEQFKLPNELVDMYDFYFERVSSWLFNAAHIRKEDLESVVKFTKVEEDNKRLFYKMKKRSALVLSRSKLNVNLVFSTYDRDALGYFNFFRNEISLFLGNCYENYQTNKLHSLTRDPQHDIEITMAHELGHKFDSTLYDSFRSSIEHQILYKNATCSGSDALVQRYRDILMDIRLNEEINAWKNTRRFLITPFSENEFNEIRKDALERSRYAYSDFLDSMVNKEKSLSLS